MSQGEAQARALIELQRRQFLRQLFQGTTLNTKLLFKAKTIQTLNQSVQGVGAAIGRAGVAATKPARDTARDIIIREAIELLTALFGIDPSLIAEIAEELGAEVLRQILGILADAAPFLGVATSGVSAFKSWGLTARDAYRKIKVYRAQDGLLPGDPQAAVEAVKALIQRELTRDAITATRMTTLTAVQATAAGLTIAEIGAAPITFGGTALLAGPTAMMGPAAGVMNAVLGLIHQIFLIGRDFWEKRKANKRLANPETLDATVFQVCPLLGCYLLTCADLSTIINLDVQEIGQKGWMDKVEKLRNQKIQPVLIQASRLIVAHRFVLDGIDGQTAEGIQLISKGKIIHGDGILYDIRRLKARTQRQVIGLAKSVASQVRKK